MKKVLNLSEVVLILTLLLTAFSCKKESQCENAVEGKIVNMTGLDGCGWMIQLNSGARLEPTNLNEFDINLEDNKEIYITYHTAPNLASICMVGQIIEIDCIEER